MRLSAIIVAGGIGKRMGVPLPKQFLKLAGRPIIIHTIEKFIKAFSHLNFKLIIVLHKDYINYFNDLIQTYNINYPITITEGGLERFFSVKKGLQHAYSQGYIMIHDAVRPLITTKFLQKALDEAIKYSNSIPYTLPKSSIRIEKPDGSNYAIDRTTVRLIQTPQTFDAYLLKKAFEIEYKPIFTDDATVYEYAGHKIHLFPGLEENIKITTTADLHLAEFLIKKLE